MDVNIFPEPESDTDSDKVERERGEGESAACHQTSPISGRITRSPSRIQGRVSRSPSPIQRRSPSPIQGRSLSPIQGRSLSPIQGRSPSPIQGRSLSQGRSPSSTNSFQISRSTSPMRKPYKKRFGIVPRGKRGVFKAEPETEEINNPNIPIQRVKPTVSLSEHLNETSLSSDSEDTDPSWFPEIRRGSPRGRRGVTRGRPREQEKEIQMMKCIL
ncbi:hypothetical protein AVEN_79368-1 [Araneus ventricosus]|uniref:Uncharacterized protein n=1 Tax=Araneus ventricosus TaxID=182803 RepID=A0A4Y2VB41_ARAVE|nr:hypothetical protein AVEN_79368-1 [Araneus ventricosus]